ncbi:MAG: hypothetical protein U0175_11145 [Caldilineaceae bacterium]
MQARTLDNFIGTWQLIPERSIYSAGGPPKSATYQISGNQAELTFTIQWIDQNDKPFHVSYRCVPDGARHSDPSTPTVDQIQTELIDHNLQTLSYKDDKLVAIADRKLSADSNELEVTQKYLRPDGGELNILQFYSKL